MNNTSERIGDELQMYREIVENMAEGVFLVRTKDGVIVYANPANERIFGYASGKLAGNHISAVTAPSDKAPEETAQEIMQALKTNGVWKGVVQNLKKDGTLIWCQSYVSTFNHPQHGSVWVFVHEDISEQRQAQEALRESEERFRTLVEWTPEPITVHRDGKFIYFNSAANKVLGATDANNLVGKPISALVHSDFIGTVKERMQIIAKQGTSVPRIEEKFLKMDGTVIDVEVEGTSIFYDGLPAIHVSWRDITQRKRVEEKLSRQLSQLQLLRTIDNAIISSVDLDSILKLIAQKAVEQLQIDAAAILLLNPKTQTLDFAAAEGFHTNALQSTRLEISKGTAGQVAQERRTIHISNLQKSNANPMLATAIKDEGFVSYFGIPLIAKEQLLGVLEIFDRSPLPSDTDWLSFVEMLAGQVSISIDNATLFRDLQKSNIELEMAYDATLEGWARALDLRDKETEGHTRRVTNLTIQLASAFRLGSEEILNIKRGALLHDIGKMGIPDSILLKPGPLTDEEWIVMRRHPIYAYEMLFPIQYLKNALNIPYCHHEKWDGSGYPQELKGEEIPISARIFAVVDVWDAVTSNRPYRTAWSKEKAFEYIKSESGKHFDPNVVEKFLTLISRD